MSVDLRLGRKFTWFKDPPPAHVPAIRVAPSLWNSLDLWEETEAPSFTLNPRHLILAQTLERVYIPHDLVGFVEGRSSYARVGISIHVTAPKIDPGFDAQVTLEMFNHGTIPVELHAEEDMPAQLLLMKVSRPLPGSDLYGKRQGDYFQYQTDPIPRGRRRK